MENLEPTEIFKFHPNTLEEVRKAYNLHQPGAMADAINILEEWVKQQDHFVKKDFEREYLERLIIRSKGSVENAKQKLDKMCTARTLMPEFFYNGNVNDLPLSDVLGGMLPNTTADKYRIYIARITGQDFASESYTNYYKRSILGVEYLYRHDYSHGVIIILDLLQANLLEMTKKLDLIEFQNFQNMLMKSFGHRIKAIHMLTKSKFIEALLSVLRQLLSAKMMKRIFIHRTLEDVYAHVDRKLLPSDYGGDEKPLKEISDINQETVALKENHDYIQMMNAACTNEAYRQVDKFNEDCLGMPGTFRTLNVD